jgi:uncharacterized protein
MYPSTDLYKRLRSAVDAIPVIDCHDHTSGPKFAPEWKEPLHSLIGGYFHADLISAGAEAHMEFFNDPTIDTDKKWRLFQPFWEKTKHTSYAQVPKIILKKFYGEDELNLETLHRIRDRLVTPKNVEWYRKALADAQIKIRIVNIWPNLRDYIDGTFTLEPTDRMMIPLPGFHSICNYDSIQAITGLVDQHVTCLDEYEVCCYQIFELMKERGTLGMKDQSAYNRIIHFEPTPRSEAEKLFNRIIQDPRASLGYPERKPLDDYLFHQFMRMARDLEFPVQMHTGHMAGVRNDIVKTNAAHLTNVIELHRDVSFDLFHGNWPYMGEFLYLGKNHPNVALDLCWATFIDAYYSKNLLCDALTVVPHGKIHLFGADTGDYVEYAVAHLELTKDVLAAALGEMVERQWITEKESMTIAADWLYNNPNEFFNLGLEPYSV